jgi:hypothetical protein
VNFLPLYSLPVHQSGSPPPSFFFAPFFAPFFSSFFSSPPPPSSCHRKSFVSRVRSSAFVGWG